jgi:hypothetical protein
MLSQMDKRFYEDDRHRSGSTRAGMSPLQNVFQESPEKEYGLVRLELLGVYDVLDA